MFTPFNFHDSDPTRRSAQGVRISNSNDETKVRYYGGRYQKGAKLQEVSLKTFSNRLTALSEQPGY